MDAGRKRAGAKAVNGQTGSTGCGCHPTTMDPALANIWQAAAFWTLQAPLNPVKLTPPMRYSPYTVHCSAGNWLGTDIDLDQWRCTKRYKQQVGACCVRHGCLLVWHGSGYSGPYMYRRRHSSGLSPPERGPHGGGRGSCRRKCFRSGPLSQPAHLLPSISLLSFFVCRRRSLWTLAPCTWLVPLLDPHQSPTPQWSQLTAAARRAPPCGRVSPRRCSARPAARHVPPACRQQQRQ